MPWVDEDGKPVTDPTITKELDAQRAQRETPSSPEESGGARFVRGMERGGAGFLVEAGDAAKAAAMQFVDPQGASEPPSPETMRASGPLREFANAPTTGLETLGRGTAYTLPFLAQPEVFGGRALPMLGRLADDVGWGAISGFLQPSPSNELHGHATQGLAGAAGGAMLTPLRGMAGLSGHLLDGILAHILGPHMGHHSLMAYHALHRRGVGQKLANYIQELMRAGPAGAWMGQSYMDKDDGRSRQTKDQDRPPQR